MTETTTSAEALATVAELVREVNHTAAHQTAPTSSPTGCTTRTAPWRPCWSVSAVSPRRFLVPRHLAGGRESPWAVRAWRHGPHPTVRTFRG